MGPCFPSSWIGNCLLLGTLQNKAILTLKDGLAFNLGLNFDSKINNKFSLSCLCVGCIYTVYCMYMCVGVCTRTCVCSNKCRGQTLTSSLFSILLFEKGSLTEPRTCQSDWVGQPIGSYLPISAYLPRPGPMFYHHRYAAPWCRRSFCVCVAFIG